MKKVVGTSVKGKIYVSLCWPDQYHRFLSAEKIWKRVIMQRLRWNWKTRISEKLVKFMTGRFSREVEVTILINVYDRKEA